MTAPSATPASAPATRPTPPKRRWPSRVAALAATGLFAAGIVLLADWIVGRDGAAPPAGRKAPQSAGLRVREPDPRMRAWLPESVAFGPVTEVPFGRDASLFAAGSSSKAPEDVFAAILRPLQTPFDKTTVAAAVRAGPLATSFRTHATVGRYPGGAFLVRLAPDARSASHASARLEPGGVALAFPSSHGWEYVVFYFPNGLDLDALSRETKPDPRSIAALGAEGASVLEPTLAFAPPGRASGPSTVLCRARGRPEEAIERVARGLVSRGYARRDVPGSGESDGACVLSGPETTVWLTSPERDRAGGLVTVLLGAP